MSYLFFYDSFPADFSFKQTKTSFQNRLAKYDSVSTQLFGITMVASDQVTQSLENPELESFYALYSQNVINLIENEHKDVLLDQLVMENELSEFQIKTRIEEFLDKYKSKISGSKNQGFAFISLMSTNNNVRYFYFYHCDLPRKVITLFKTVSRRKFESEIMGMFEKLASSIGFMLIILQDLPRNYLASNCPEVFISFLIEKVLMEGMDFQKALRICHYNLVPFILDENDFGELLQDESSGLPDNQGVNEGVDYDEIEDDYNEGDDKGKEGYLT